jgi:hypothetical protein
LACVKYSRNLALLNLGFAIMTESWEKDKEAACIKNKNSMIFLQFMVRR